MHCIALISSAFNLFFLNVLVCIVLCCFIWLSTDLYHCLLLYFSFNAVFILIATVLSSFLFFFTAFCWFVNIFFYILLLLLLSHTVLECFYSQMFQWLVKSLSLARNIQQTYNEHYIILNNEILNSNSSIFPQSKGYITQYTP